MAEPIAAERAARGRADQGAPSSARWTIDLDEALEEEAKLQGIAGASADHAEGLAAFREKRPPRSRGS